MLSVVRVASVGVGVVVALAGCKGPPSQPDQDRRVTDDELREPPPDLSLGHGYSVGRPIADGRISLVPVYAAAPPKVEFVALTDAMRDGKVTVSESNIGYDSVQIVNNSDRRVFAMTGELIVEAHQDRTLAENTIISPHETRTVAVRCVEARRSYGPSNEFKPLGVIAEPGIRRRIRYKDQSAVWSQVNEINYRLGLHPDTETYRGAALQQLDGENKARRDRLLAQLALAPDRDHMVGLGLAVDGKMIAIDRFVTPALYRSVEPRLVASYLPAERDQVAMGVAHELSPGDVRSLAHPSTEATTEANAEYLRPLEDTERSDDRD